VRMGVLGGVAVYGGLIHEACSSGSWSGRLLPRRAVSMSVGPILPPCLY
jgi:hypothetical protein